MSESFEYINSPQDLKKIPVDRLLDYAIYLRKHIVDTILLVGGHLGSGLGVIELTIALHYTFDTPNDKIIWDTGHQSYPHKCITGRKHLLSSIRQSKGISGFTKRDESVYDVFGAGHSSTSIAVALGMLHARDINNNFYEIVSVIGDGALSAGLAFEGLNNLNNVSSKMFIIVNDNQMSISKGIGSIHDHLSSLRKKHGITRISDLDSPEEYLDHMLSNSFNEQSNLFELFGALYIGPVDGHDLLGLIILFSFLKKQKKFNKPICIHIVTIKGNGFDSTEYNNAESYHSISPVTAQGSNSIKKKYSYSKIFVDELNALAQKDHTLVAITAAMQSGTGLNDFKYMDRLFDVGIAEPHAVVFASSLSLYGCKPFCCIYSTFMQRAYDQVIHDVAIQSAPVRFIIDRAGLVGSDGETHNGTYDIMYFINLPNFIIMCPSSAYELRCMLHTSYFINDAPSVIRFPKDVVQDISVTDTIKKLDIGKGKVVSNTGNDILVLSLGNMLHTIESIADILLKEYKISSTIIDMRFAKPFDHELVFEFASKIKHILIVEEGVYGGFTSQVYKFIVENCNMKQKIHSICFPDRFIEHGSIECIRKIIMMDQESILNRILNFLKHSI